MKKSVEIINLPIISIVDGNEIGSVKSLVINPEKGAVDFLTIDQEEWQESVKAIPFKKVVGIGEYALMIENENAIIDLSEIPIANQLVDKKITINDSRVITRKGQLIGDVTEYVIDDETGKIIEMFIKMKESQISISADQVITYGKNIIINEEAAENDVLKASRKPVELVREEKSVVNQAFLSLRDKQRELLIGKKVMKNIYNTEGQLIIEEETILDKEDIERAQEAGPGVFVEVTMNING
jgi:uncharacterized protein YrrD